MTKTLTYERQVCGRCGGSGRYSFNMVDGNRCYGCGGSGQKLTKRGAATRAYASELLEVPIENLPPGRRAVYQDLMSGKKITFSVAEREEKPCAWIGAEKKPVYGYKLLQRRDGQLVPSSIGITEGIKVRMIPTEEEVSKVAEYQDQLTKAGKPRKRSK